LNSVCFISVPIQQRHTAKPLGCAGWDSRLAIYELDHDAAAFVARHFGQQFVVLTVDANPQKLAEVILTSDEW